MFVFNTKNKNGWFSKVPSMRFGTRPFDINGNEILDAEELYPCFIAIEDEGTLDALWEQALKESRRKTADHLSSKKR